ncbi:MAG: hypothetical protein O7B99_02450 [Planctomycetota bacterium]|nr:hypothetical protein [Planctomycetota bacterium]
MKNARKSLLTILAGPALLAFSMPTGDVGFHPAVGTVLTKSYETSAEVILDEMSIVMNGQEMDPDMMQMDMSISASTTIVVTDEYAAVDGSRPTKLMRTYGAVESSSSTSMSNAFMGDMDMNLSGESELQGLTVVFTWNEEEGDYTLEFDGDEGDEELLEGLVEDTDLRGFLPTEDVSPGDTWEIETEEMRKVLAFGGALKIEFDTSELPEEMRGFGSGPPPSPDAFLGDLEGTVTAEYVENRQEDGVAVAVIKISCEISSAKDMTDFFKEMMEDGEMPEGFDMEMEVHSADNEYEFEGEGLLLWNLEAGHVYSFELRGSGTTTMDMAMAMTVQGNDMDFEQMFVMSSDETITITTSSGE